MKKLKLRVFKLFRKKANLWPDLLNTIKKKKKPCCMCDQGDDTI